MNPGTPSSPPPCPLPTLNPSPLLRPLPLSPASIATRSTAQTSRRWTARSASGRSGTLPCTASSPRARSRSSSTRGRCTRRRACAASLTGSTRGVCSTAPSSTAGCAARGAAPRLRHCAHAHAAAAASRLRILKALCPPVSVTPLRPQDKGEIFGILNLFRLVADNRVERFVKESDKLREEYRVQARRAERPPTGAAQRQRRGRGGPTHQHTGAAFGFERRFAAAACERCSLRTRCDVRG